MFDYHMHTRLSYDGTGDPEKMIQKALDLGLKEICFTEHVDFDPRPEPVKMDFDVNAYQQTYEHLDVPGIKIRRGMEFGILRDNQEDFKKALRRYPFDFVIGSMHFVDDFDIYEEEFWLDISPQEAERRYFDQLLDCVRAHDDFDVLGHITYIGKLIANPCRRPIGCTEYKDHVDEILRILAQRGKGIEINTSGFDRCGAYLPGVDYLRRFKELGGEIVTVGSDTHDEVRVGQYCHDACLAVADVFGYVCTFENRKPIFHKL